MQAGKQASRTGSCIATGVQRPILYTARPHPLGRTAVELLFAESHTSQFTLSDYISSFMIELSLKNSTTEIRDHACADTNSHQR